MCEKEEHAHTHLFTVLQQDDVMLISQNFVQLFHRGEESDGVQAFTAINITDVDVHHVHTRLIICQLSS